MSTETTQTHGLLVAYAPWAHCRSMVALAGRLMGFNPNLHITLLVPSIRATASEVELAQYPYENRERLIMGRYSPKEEPNTLAMTRTPMEFVMEAESALATIYPALFKVSLVPFKSYGRADRSTEQGEEVFDPYTGNNYTTHKIPFNFFITDFVLGPSRISLASSWPKVFPDKPLPKNLTYDPLLPAFIAWCALPEICSFPGHIANLMAIRDNKEEQAKLFQKLIGSSTEVVKLPGLTPFYMHEAEPCIQYSWGHQIDLADNLIQAFNSIEGVIAGWPFLWGKEYQEASLKKFGAFYQIGPQIPPKVKDEWHVENKHITCKAFLDQCLEEYGALSVLYISFGSSVYSPTAEQLKILLAVLREMQIPYITSCGNSQPDIKTILKENVGIGKEDKGLLLDWTPQRAILSHPACGWFMSQLGASSALEMVYYGVPGVFWPGAYDQPLIANELAGKGVGKYLVQIRTGPNIGKTTYDGVLVEGTEAAMRKEFRETFEMFSTAEGAKIRDNMRALSEELHADAEPGGGSYEAMKQLAYLK
ncbi:hypothetical protein P7C73_g1687, partial [Tremellales sp. Uapishka_1]